MKKTILYGVIGCAFALSSCGSNFLDVDPTDRVEINKAITSIEDAQNAVNGMYDIMQSANYYSGYEQIYGDVKGDDMQVNSSSVQRTSYKMYIFEHRADQTNAANLWSSPFALIRAACRVIDAIDEGRVTDGTPEQRNHIKGHAMAMRALGHFDIVRTHGYPYAKDGGASWGAPIVDHVLDLDEHPIRSTVKETFDFITSELEQALPLMNTDKYYGQMNRYGAQALLARAYLYCENNQKAFDTASALIEELVQTGTYSLYTHQNYMDNFAYGAEFGSESLLEVVNTASDDPGWTALSYMTHWWGYADVICTQAFGEFITSDPDDVRSKMVKYYRQSSTGIYKYILAKYPGPAENQPSRDNNYPVIRLSEVYLIAAEAAVKLNKEPELSLGLGYLNTIVKRGNPANNVTMAQYDLDRVLTERRKELVGEGHRYYDLLRNGRTIVREGGYHLTAVLDMTDQINWNYYKSILPIPQSQFTLNPKMQQNDRY